LAHFLAAILAVSKNYPEFNGQTIFGPKVFVATVAILVQEQVCISHKSGC